MVLVFTTSTQESSTTESDIVFDESVSLRRNGKQWHEFTKRMLEGVARLLVTRCSKFTVFRPLGRLGLGSCQFASFCRTERSQGGAIIYHLHSFLHCGSFYGIIEK